MSDSPPASPIASDTTSAPWRSPRLWAFTLAVYWLGLFVATHWPSEVPALAGGVLDKIAHFSAFAVLSLLLAGTTATHDWALTPRVLLVLWLVVAAYGAIDELLQTPVGRSCELYDWLADLAGAGVALLVVKAVVSKAAAEN